MSENFINVHVFDGRLQNLFPDRTYSIENKNVLFNELIKKIKDHNAILTIKIIIEDMKISNGNNYHPDNKLDASDILADILIHKNYENMIDLLSEQLSDINSLGQCNSGRVTRLLQFWLACNDL
jgi:hypothetical protein